MSEGFDKLTSLKTLDLSYSPAGKNTPPALKAKLEARGCTIEH